MKFIVKHSGQIFAKFFSTQNASGWRQITVAKDKIL